VLTAWVDRWPVSITRQHGPCWRARVSTSRVDQHGPSTRLVETRARQLGPCWRVMETGHPSTWAVNTGSGNGLKLVSLSLRCCYAKVGCFVCLFVCMYVLFERLKVTVKSCSIISTIITKPCYSRCSNCASYVVCTQGQGPHRSWKVTEFKKGIFQAWKVMKMAVVTESHGKKSLNSTNRSWNFLNRRIFSFNSLTI